MHPPHDSPSVPSEQSRGAIAPARAGAPAWLRAADASVLLMAAASVSITVFGGFRVGFGGVTISAHYTIRPLLAAAVIFAVRHLIRRAPSQPVRIVNGLRGFVNAESVRDIAPVFFWSRAGVLLVAALSLSTFGYPGKVPFRVSRSELANLPARWDGGWYLGVATDGYRFNPLSQGQQNVAFFPAFPLLMRAAGVFLGGHTTDQHGRFSSAPRLIWSGVIVNLAALAWALGYIYWMVRAVAGREAALASVNFALVYPAAFIFNAPYTEGLFLLASVGAFYHLTRGQPLAAACWGAVAGLTRPNGFLLAAPLLAIAVARSGLLPSMSRYIDRLQVTGTRSRRPAVQMLAAMAPVAGMLIFSGYLYATFGEPFLWERLHRAWGRTYQGLEPAMGPVRGMLDQGVAGYAGTAGYEVLHVIPFLLAVGLSIPIARRLGLAYTTFILITVLPPLLAGGWLSMARITVVLFPMYVFLGIATPLKQRTGIMVAFCLLQALGAALFFTWRPFY